MATVAQFESYVQQLSSTNNNSLVTPSFRRFTIAVGRESILSIKLLLRRPLHKLPPSFRPIPDTFNVLKAGTDVLESAAFKAHPEFAQWARFSWVKWYALAIVLAELCDRTHAWSEEVEGRAWNIARREYDRYGALVADAETGLLWEPIVRLMRRVEVVVRQTPWQDVGSAIQVARQLDDENGIDEQFQNAMTMTGPQGSVEPALMMSREHLSKQNTEADFVTQRRTKSA